MIAICCASPGEHVDAGDIEACERRFLSALAVLIQSAVSAEPGEAAFDHPSAGTQNEAFRVSGPLDDLELWGSAAEQGEFQLRP